MFGSTSDPVMAAMGTQRQQDKFLARAKRARIVESAHNGHGLMQLVHDKLKARYDPETFQEMKIDHGIATWNRIFQDILSKVNVEWAEGAEYSLDGPNGSEVASEELARFQNYIDVANYDDSVMRPTSRWGWIHDGICVMPVVTWCPQIGMRKFHHVLLTPEHFDLEPNPADATDWIALNLYEWEPGSEEPCRKTRWDCDFWVQFEMKQGKWKEVARGVNDYGCVPAVIFYGDPSATGIWGHNYGAMLTDLAVEMNIAETVLSFVGPLQIKVLAGAFKSTPNAQNLAQGKGLINFGEETGTVLDLQTDIARYRDVYINQPRRAAAVTMGLPADEFELTGTPPSGEALKMRKAGVDQQAIARRRPLSASLKKLYWLGMRVLYARIPDKMTEGEYAGQQTPIQGFGEWPKTGTFVAPDPGSVLPPYDDEIHHWTKQPYKFCIDVNETVYPELAAEREARENRDISMGYSNRVIEYKTRNPDVDDVTARKAVMDNMAMEAEFRAAANAGTGRPAGVGLLKPRTAPVTGAQVAQQLGEDALASNETKDLAAAAKALAGAAKTAAPAPVKAPNG